MRSKFTQVLQAAALGALIYVTTLDVAAAADYPEKPIRVVVAYTPGAAADAAIRLIQPTLEKRFGQTLVVDYKPGAGGSIAVQEVAHAAPDGYTLLLGGTNNFVIDQFRQPQAKLDPLKALAPIIKIAEVPGVLFVSKDLQVRNWAELKAKRTSPARRLTSACKALEQRRTSRVCCWQRRPVSTLRMSSTEAHSRRFKHYFETTCSCT